MEVIEKHLDGINTGPMSRAELTDSLLVKSGYFQC